MKQHHKTARTARRNKRNRRNARLAGFPGEPATAEHFEIFRSLVRSRKLLASLEGTAESTSDDIAAIMAMNMRKLIAHQLRRLSRLSSR